jgi:hypothetical protein
MESAAVVRNVNTPSKQFRRCRMTWQMLRYRGLMLCFALDTQAELTDAAATEVQLHRQLTDQAESEARFWRDRVGVLEAQLAALLCGSSSVGASPSPPAAGDADATAMAAAEGRAQAPSPQALPSAALLTAAAAEALRGRQRLIDEQAATIDRFRVAAEQLKARCIHLLVPSLLGLQLVVGATMVCTARTLAARSNSSTPC